MNSAHRWTSTGILQCVRTLTVSLPMTIAETPWRPCGPIGVLMLDLNRLACDAGCLRCAEEGAKSFFGMVVARISSMRVGRKRMKRLQDYQRGDFGTDSLDQGDTVLDGLPNEFRAVRWY
jgi:hypothetical protein